MLKSRTKTWQRRSINSCLLKKQVRQMQHPKQQLQKKLAQKQLLQLKKRNRLHPNLQTNSFNVKHASYRPFDAGNLRVFFGEFLKCGCIAACRTSPGKATVMSSTVWHSGTSKQPTLGICLDCSTNPAIQTADALPLSRLFDSTRAPFSRHLTSHP